MNILGNIKVNGSVAGIVGGVKRLLEHKVCPFCFEDIETEQPLYRCINQHCSAQAPDDKIKAYLRTRNAPTLGHVFNCQKRGDAVCDVCGDGRAIRICPHCHNALPESTVRGSDNIISIVGTRGSGKSHYIAVLINELIREVAYSMNASILPVVDLSGVYDCDKCYHETKYDPLFKKQKTLELTHPDTGNLALEPDKIPLIYSWTYTDGSKPFTLAFFDAAGEDLQNPQMIATVARYLEHSRGIIFLIDPLQIEEVREQLEQLRGGKLTSLAGVEEARTFDAVLANITTQIKDSRKLAPGKKIDIPVAITFSKFDEVIPIAQDALTIQQPSPHAGKGGFIEADHQNVDGEIRTLLERWGESSVLTNVAGNFSNASYFAVSSLGLNNAPDQDQHVNRPHPHRVEDPLLWIMSKNGLIKSI